MSDSVLVTRTGSIAEIKLHRQVMRAVRALKDSIPAAELNNWFAAANEAQAA